MVPNSFSGFPTNIKPIGFTYSIFLFNYTWQFFTFQSMLTFANSDVSWSKNPCDTDLSNNNNKRYPAKFTIYRSPSP